tara:strand:- start:6784 stop:8172 length:1389 start_codon:yes stop_codon:yes gene_type:complete
MPAELKTFPDLFKDWIRRVITYTDRIRYFGENSVGYAFGRADAHQGSQTNLLYRTQLRRYTIIGASGDDLNELMEEAGTRKRGAQRSRVLVIVRPHTAIVTDVDGGLIEVDDSTNFFAGSSLRIRSADGAATEAVTVDAVLIAAGPNGGDQLDVGSLTNIYAPATEDVKILRRVTILEGSALASDAGIGFQTLEDVSVGDLNPVLDGESSALALADKVWCEATTKGIAGNIEFNTIQGFTGGSPPDIQEALNPERGFAGADVETDFDGKFRATHIPAISNQETQAWLEALSAALNRDVLRVFESTSSKISTMLGIVLSRNGGGLSSDAREALQEGLNQRTRSHLSVEIRNMVLTSVEIIGEVTLDPGPATPATRLKTAWTRAADTYATFLDLRKWEQGRLVDEADLISILIQTQGIATVRSSTFQPSVDILVGDTSLPIFTRLFLTDTVSGETYGADLTATF